MLTSFSDALPIRWSQARIASRTRATGMRLLVAGRAA